MSGQLEGLCPLCLKPAHVLGKIDFGRHKVFQCQDCGEFAVSDLADARIRGLPTEFKDAWRKKIHATTNEELFVIKVSPVGSGSHLQEERLQRR